MDDPGKKSQIFSKNWNSLRTTTSSVSFATPPGGEQRGGGVRNSIKCGELDMDVHHHGRDGAGFCSQHHGGHRSRIGHRGRPCSAWSLPWELSGRPAGGDPAESRRRPKRHVNGDTPLLRGGGLAGLLARRKPRMMSTLIFMSYGWPWRHSSKARANYGRGAKALGHSWPTFQELEGYCRSSNAAAPKEAKGESSEHRRFSRMVISERRYRRTVIGARVVLSPEYCVDTVRGTAEVTVVSPLRRKSAGLPFNHQSPFTNHHSPITIHQSPFTNHHSPITNHRI